ncbi:DUF4177 domain-containing protein [Pontivivens ytuae]|uniref:DUF4177 domain-containing protein n=1 Tax=Pontivivens ytuae TaxID=2789856 RepID=A0A7S9LTP4_9RHOB|nr:DUF4177 domain-containing protein [Pontivivens ytuae]QPH54988.1 hypothetical protein I0K15_04340 [Pontivivens ytuae]
MGDMEYKTVPLPTKPRKYKGVKDRVEQYNRTLMDVLNEEARGGWTYLRPETLPATLKKGMFGGTETQTMTFLLFGRERVSEGARMRAEPRAGSAEGLAARLGTRREPAVDPNT